MPNVRRPSLRVPPKQESPTQAVTTEPVGLPQPKAAPMEEPDVALAKAAVDNFSNQRRMLLEMKEDWENNFPEARQAYQDILRQEDATKEALASAKALVAIAKKTVGEFIASRKFSKAHYDEEETTKILASLENRAAVIDEMMSCGVIDAIGLNRDVALAWFAQRPSYEKVFEPAFRDKQEMTCAVTTPKL